jgi:hypothetical protein
MATLGEFLKHFANCMPPLRGQVVAQRVEYARADNEH